jgi:hypothetical protein
VDLGSSERLAMQISIFLKFMELKLESSGTKTNLPPAIQMLCWLLPQIAALPATNKDTLYKQPKTLTDST